MKWENAIEHVAISDVGLRRANNQDSYADMATSSAEYWRSRGHLFVVADGMGAHAAGELASQMAAEAVPHLYSKLTDTPPPLAIVKAVKDANRQIYQRGKANAEFEGMGTTCSILLLLPQGAMVAQVGDSRVYRLRGQQLDQLSFDHSLVWELEARGALPEQSEFVPKNIITRSLGPSPEVQVDLEGPFPIEVGDVYLVCSDGLSGQVEDEELGAILHLLEPQEAAQTLVDIANLRGGPDNITLIIAKVGGPPINPQVYSDTSFDIPGESSPIPLGGWAALGGLALATGLLLVLGKWLFALVGVVSLLGTAGFVFRQQLFGSSGDKMVISGGLYGRGPYRHYPVKIDQSFVDKLLKLSSELKDAAEAEKWTIDWAEFQQYHTRAEAAIKQSDFHTASREYCRSISFMMRQARLQRQESDD